MEHVVQELVSTGEADLFVRIEGNRSGPWIILSNSMCTSYEMWAPQVASLKQHFRLLRYDHRGHFRSPPAPNCSIPAFGRDAISLMNHFGIDKTQWCGISLGGMIGQWMAINAPARVDRLIVANATYHYPDRSRWDERIELVRKSGLAALIEPTLGVWFSERFRAASVDTDATFRTMIGRTPDDIYIDYCEAISRLDHRDGLRNIIAPTLILGGRYDISTPWQVLDEMRAAIPGAALTMLSSAHMSNVEDADGFTAAVLRHLLP